MAKFEINVKSVKQSEQVGTTEEGKFKITERDKEKEAKTQEPTEGKKQDNKK